MGILQNSLKVVYTFSISPYGTRCISKHLSIDIMSLTGQCVNCQMKDAIISMFLFQAPASIFVCLPKHLFFFPDFSIETRGERLASPEFLHNYENDREDVISEG